MYVRRYIEYGYLHGHVRQNYKIHTLTSNWRLDFHLGDGACAPCTSTIPDWQGQSICFWHVSNQPFWLLQLVSAPLPLSHVFPPANLWRSNLPAVKKKGRLQFCLYYFSKAKNSGELAIKNQESGIRNQQSGRIIIVPLLVQSYSFPDSHKNVHKNLINHNLRCFMQGENHRIKIIFSPETSGMRVCIHIPEPEYLAST